MASPTTTEPPRSFAEKLNLLFAKIYPASQGRPYVAREVSEGIARMGGTVSENYILALKKGARPRPGFDVVQAIARFFGVSLAFFDDEADTAEYERKLTLVAALRDAGIENIVARSSPLNEANIKFLQDVIEHLRAQQGLDAGQPPAGDA